MLGVFDALTPFPASLTVCLEPTVELAVAMHARSPLVMLAAERRDAALSVADYTTV